MQLHPVINGLLKILFHLTRSLYPQTLLSKNLIISHAVLVCAVLKKTAFERTYEYKLTPRVQQPEGESGRKIEM